MSSTNAGTEAGAVEDAPLVRRVTEPVLLPTRFGSFQAIGYEEVATGDQHVALVRGELIGEAAVLVRIHSECLTGDVFGSERCDCGEQLQRALRMIHRGGGALVYMRRHEGRGIGLHNKLRAYKLQEQGLDTVDANLHLGFPADARDFRPAVEIVRDLGIRKVRLITNNPDKVSAVFEGENRGLDLVETIPLEVQPNVHNRRYLEAKRARMGHVLELRERTGT